MKKSTNLKLNIFAVVVSFIVGAFVILPSMVCIKPFVARAEDVNETVVLTGNVYVTGGDGNFCPLVGSNDGILLYLMNDTIETSVSSVSSDGQFYFELPVVQSNVSWYTLKIVDHSNNAYYTYLFNDVTHDKTLGALNQKVNFFGVYFRYYAISRTLGDDIYNYEYNTIVFNTQSAKLTQSRLFVPAQFTGYYNSMTFSMAVSFAANYDEYPALWLNFNDSNNKFVLGYGIIGVYKGSTSDYPWIFYIKDNVSGKKVEIGRYNQSAIPTTTCRLRITTYRLNNRTYIDCYYMTDLLLGEWKFFRQTLTDVNTSVFSVFLQASSSRGSAKYSITFNGEPKPLNYTLLQKHWFDQGYKAGDSDGFDRGVIAGVNQDTYSFWDLISAVIDVPVGTLTKFFDVEILGVNMKSFIFSIATVFIVLAIVRIWLGSRGV